MRRLSLALSLASFFAAHAQAQSRAFVRRFSASGASLDEVPVQVIALPYREGGLEAAASIAGGSETYLVAWPQPFPNAGTFFRRMSADSGAWLDPQPFRLDFTFGTARFVSNGTGVMAAGLIACGDVNLRCLASQPIALHGEPLAAPLVTLRVPATHTDIAEATVASNGSDYLAVWAEAEHCDFPCGNNPQRPFAVRLRADGTAVAPAPVVLDPVAGRIAAALTVAWSSGRYLVAWVDNGPIRGTRLRVRPRHQREIAVRGGARRRRGAA